MQMLFITLPWAINSLIIQYGYVVKDTTSFVTFKTFPISYTNSYSLCISRCDNNGVYTYTMDIMSNTLTEFSIGHSSTAAPVTWVKYNYISIGY